MSLKNREEGYNRKTASASDLKEKQKNFINFCEDSGYSSDSSSASASSSKQKRPNHNASKDSFDYFPTPDLNWKSISSSHIHTQARISESSVNQLESNLIFRCNSTPLDAQRCCKELPSPKLPPIEGPLLRSKTYPDYSKSSMNLFNLSSSFDYSQIISPTLDSLKTSVKIQEKKSYISLRSPLKSPFKLFKKQKSAENISENLFANPEVKQRTVKSLFTSKDNDVTSTPVKKVSPKLGNILKRMMEIAPYLLPKVFSYLSDEEILNISHACKQFRDIIDDNSKLKSRKNLFIEKRKEDQEKIGKENFKQKCITPSISDFSVSTPRKHLQQLQNSKTSEKQPAISPSKPLTRFDKFVKEGKKLLPGESQTKCAHCQNPARIISSESKAVCTDSSCGYIYCTRCFMPIHEKSSDCNALKPKSTKSNASKIFSKACKKRLRRL